MSVNKTPLLHQPLLSTSFYNLRENAPKMVKELYSLCTYNSTTQSGF